MCFACQVVIVLAFSLQIVAELLSRRWHDILLCHFITCESSYCFQCIL